MSKLGLFFSLCLFFCIIYSSIHIIAYAEPIAGAASTDEAASTGADASKGSPPKENWYVGTEACAECHSETVQNFKANSKKAGSKKSVIIMREKLTAAEFEECLSCHTTGYGKKSGFISYEQTPHLADVGCESCHGMGGLHTEDGSAESISRKPTLKLCETCHDDSRINRISYDGRIYSGAH